MTIAVDIRRTEELSRAVLREHPAEVMRKDVNNAISGISGNNHHDGPHSLNRSLPSGGNSSVK